MARLAGAPAAAHPEVPRLVLVTGTLEGGGAERVLSDMANYWAQRGYGVTVATWSAATVADFYPLDPRVRRSWLDVHAPNDSILARLRSNFARILRLRRLLSEAKPHAVLSFIHTSNVLTILAAMGLGVRIVVSERMQPAVDPTLSFVWRILRRLAYPWSDAIVGQTDDAARWIAQHCGKQAIAIANPLRRLPEPCAERETLILAVGRLSHQKGFDLLLHAFARLAPAFPGWTVAIAGVGDQRDALIRLCDTMKLTGRVELLGQVRDAESWMARAGLVVQPSRFEGFPNVVLESMAMGAAVISTDCPSGPADLIEDGVNGRLVPVDDIDALGRVMSELMSNAQDRARLGLEAQKVRQRYRQDLIMAQWEACLLPAPQLR
jgi:GalNAc-alpha-(1->4)-GalNAc-alpha-(1->3)-diNAcBac-PP-undecaprenol alpha-1,4-N-acetyl-D-galactosaminyltransferase